MEEYSNVLDEVAAPEENDNINVELYVVVVILCVFTVIGTAGNGLVIYVYSRTRDKLTSTLFILVLAVTDFMTCLIIVPFTIIMELKYFRIGDNDIACKFYHFLITCNIPFSAFIMAAIAVDRYLCICQTFLHVMSRFRAKVTVFALLMLSLSLGTFTSLAVGVYERFTFNETYPANTSSFGNITSETTIVVTRVDLTGICSTNNLIVTNTMLDIYHKIYTSLYGIAFLLVVVLYILIVCNVRMRQRQKRSASLRCEISTNSNSPTNDFPTEAFELNERNPRENGHSNKVPKERDRKTIKMDKNLMANFKMAMMLFVVTLVFIVAFLPAFLMVHRLMPFNFVVFYMYFAHNVTNPFIYSFMNRNFRHDLKTIFNCC
ncbi:unnamed protein product [Owenia fusiformis]|uniref:G-protein coupled receptors family 1 profile domain-containing protein n=1 Tax=Owenia fusiformis TaxID=6347 RepID=A0A8S4N2I9_OWEFU|nr:unnamed protein product [Owenia fusiformis]